MAVEVGKNVLDRGSKPASGAETPDRGSLAMGVSPTGYQIPLLLSADGSITAELDASDLEIGAVELKNASTDERASIEAANTARAVTTKVLAVQAIDAAGAVLATSALATSAKQPTLGTGVMAGSAPTTIATDDTQFGAVGAVAAVAGNVHAQLRTIGTALEIVDNIVATEDAAAPGGIAVMGSVAESTVPTEISDGDGGSLWMNTFKQLILAGYNLASGSQDVSEVAPALQVYFIQAMAALTAAGSTVGPSTDIYNKGTWQIVIAAIDTSVVVRIEGSLDGTSWFNVDDALLDTTYTANGTYKLNYEGKFRNTRLTFVSEVGGTNVTVTGTLMAGC